MNTSAKKLIARIITFAITISFLASDIVWAYSGYASQSTKNTSTLATSTKFRDPEFIAVAQRLFTERNAKAGQPAPDQVKKERIPWNIKAIRYLKKLIFGEYKNVGYLERRIAVFSIMGGILQACGPRAPDSRSNTSTADITESNASSRSLSDKDEKKLKIDMLKYRIIHFSDENDAMEALLKLFEMIIVEDRLDPEENDASNAVRDIIKESTIYDGRISELIITPSLFANVLQFLMEQASGEKSGKCKAVLADTDINDYLRSLLLDRIITDTVAKIAVILSIGNGFKYMTPNEPLIADERMNGFIRDLADGLDKDLSDVDRARDVIKNIHYALICTFDGKDMPVAESDSRIIRRFPLEKESALEIMKTIMSTGSFHAKASARTPDIYNEHDPVVASTIWLGDILINRCGAGPMLDDEMYRNVYRYYGQFSSKKWDGHIRSMMADNLDDILHTLFNGMPQTTQMELLCAETPDDPEALLKRLTAFSKKNPAFTKLFLEAASYRIRDILSGRVDLGLMFEILLHPDLEKTMGKFVKGPGTLWSAVRGVSQTIKHFSLISSPALIGRVMSLLSASYPAQFKRILFPADTEKVVIVIHEDEDDDRGDAGKYAFINEGGELQKRGFAKEAQSYIEAAVRNGIKRDRIIVIKGGKDDVVKDLNDEVVTSTGKIVIIFATHGSPTELAFANPKGNSLFGEMLDDEGLAAIFFARQRNGGSPDDVNIILDTCYGSDFTENVYSKLVKKQPEENRATPWVFTSANFDREARGFICSAVIAHTDNPLTFGTLFAIQDDMDLFKREDPAIFMPLAGDALTELIKLSNNGNETDPAPYAIAGTLLASNPVKTIEKIHALYLEHFGSSPIADNERIVISRDLFSEQELVGIEAALPSLFKENSPVSVLAPKELLENALKDSKRGRTDKAKYAAIITRKEYDERWKDIKGCGDIKGTVLIADDTLADMNYLYFEGLIGTARAVMSGDAGRIMRWYSLISQTMPDAKALALLNTESPNTIGFAINAILKFRPITSFGADKKLDRYRAMVEEYIRMA